MKKQQVPQYETNKMFTKIRIWWRWEARYMHKDFVQGVKNLWKWFPTIWKDRDWDHDFIYNLLAKKLEFQAKYFNNNGIHVDAKRDAERMMLVAKLIKLQHADFYAMEYMDYQVTEDFYIPVDDKPEYFEWEQVTVSQTFDEYFAKYPLCYNRAIQFANRTDSQLVAMMMGNLRQQKCKDLIFKLLNQHIESWWD
jgi:hypothetical protein